MSRQESFLDIVDATFARWPIILAAVLAGVLAGGAFGWLTQPEPGYEASLTVRYVAPAGLRSAPTADTLVAMALQPSVQTTAAAIAGVDPDAFEDTVSAAVSPRDASLVIIKTKHEDEQTAKIMAESLAEASRLEALLPAQDYIRLYEDRIENDLAKIERVEEYIEELRTELDKGGHTDEVRTTLEDRLYDQEISLLGLQDAVRSNEFNLSTYEYTVQQLGETVTEPTSGFQYVLSGGLRGAALGLFFGILVAGFVGRKGGARADAGA
jgi:hypothetical protein